MGKHKKHQFIWMMVSSDEYELPLCLRDTAEDLAEAVGTSKNNIQSTISKYKKGIIKKSRFQKVRI